jgi:predicted phosphoribosyltransferase
VISVRFDDRQDAGERLAERLRELPLHDPLVLAIPRGGIEIGAPIARGLGAELDVVLSRKLAAPDRPELALGAISETGTVHLNAYGTEIEKTDRDYVERERRRQVAAIERGRRLFRAVRPQAPVAGRSVILTDDGIATGSTMIAAIDTVRAGRPREIIVAVPVSATDRLAEIEGLCDRVVCLTEPRMLLAVGRFYRDFGQVSDARAVQLLRELDRRERASEAASARGTRATRP